MIRFSVIIACYNQVHFVKDTVNSALSQCCPDKEIIVVDDASTDGTQEVLEQYGNKITLLKNPTNQGANHGRNLGGSVAKGGHLVFLDGDDVLLPWALNVYEGIIAAKKPKVILGSLLTCKGTIPSVECADIVQAIRVLDYDVLMNRDRMYQGCASALVVDHQTFDSVKGWTNDMFPVEVDDIAMKLGYSGRTVHIWSPPTTGYRIHASNTVHQVPRFVQMMHRIIRNEKAGVYPGGPSHRFKRYAFLGGKVFFWVKRALQVRSYGPALKLFAAGWTMILAAMIQRLYVIVKGRRPLETIGCSIDNVICFCNRCPRVGQPCLHGVLKAD
jgi:glycosyltransferase involved in cell wall biosynthesis